MFVNRFWLGLLIAGALVGCSVATENLDQVSQERVFQTYTVTFDQSKDKTRSEAEFRFGDSTGTTLRLTGNSTATDSACKLAEENLFGTHYSGEAEGFIPEHVFTFINSKGQSFQNKVSIVPIAFKADTPAELSQASDYTLAWDGAPVGQGETVTVYIQDKNQKTVSVVASATEAVSVVIPAAEFAKLEKGAMNLQLTRTTSKRVEQATDRGGNMFATYKTAPRAAILKD